MKRIALLSCESLEGFVCYDELLIHPFATVGYVAEEVSWKANVDWNDYFAVIVRSTWDYQDTPDSFIEVLNSIESSSAKLFNSLRLIEWNFNKSYLKELHCKGVFIIPSLFAHDYDHEKAVSLFNDYACSEIIIKPCVSANSDDTFRLSLDSLIEKNDDLSKLFKSREHLYQPFIPSVVEKGEYSLFYFAGEFSHAILKTPKLGDFRVQEEHGGSLQSIKPSNKMRAIAEQIVSKIGEVPLYARIDLVGLDGSWALMEIELIEPSLYFNLDSQSAHRFVEAFEKSI